MNGYVPPARPHAASGAWMPGDAVGSRQFFMFDRPFALDGGATLSDVTLAYETWGTLDPDGRNAVLLCHAWTGDSHAAGEERVFGIAFEVSAAERPALDVDAWPQKDILALRECFVPEYHCRFLYEIGVPR